MFKRARNVDDPSASSTPSPSKRVRLYAGVSSPTRPQSSPASSYYTPYNSSYAYSIPSDSPSNPFGLKRTLAALTLPREIGFSKHLALRFQLVYEGPKGKARARDTLVDLDGIHRIVQVPTNYTFRHLHKLILFLFATDARWPKPPGATRPTRHRRSERLKAPLPPSVKSDVEKALSHRHAGRDKGKGKPTEPSVSCSSVSDPISSEWPGHFFEVREDISLYRGGYKPGVIKSHAGKTRVRLSSVRDRKLFPDLYEQEHSSLYHATMFGGPSTSGTPGVEETGFEDEDEDEDAGWRWEGEDDYTLRHVWPNGPELEKGIVYHHLPGVLVHITINTSRVPPRKGIGNQPFVFRWRGSTRGVIRIAHLMPAGHRYANAPERDGTSEETFEDEQDSDAQRLKRWNDRDAFARFLTLEAERERALRRTTSSPFSTSTAGSSLNANTLYSSPFLCATHTVSLPPSSPVSSPATLPHLSSASSRSAYTASSPLSHSSRRSSSVSLVSLALVGLPLETPAPTHPALARRVARASRRLERLTRCGLAEMSDGEEDEAEADKLIGDELFAEGADEGAGEESKREHAREVCEALRGKQWVGSVPEEEWDPFGEDEV